MRRYVMVLLAAVLVAACGKSPEKATDPPKPAVTTPPPATAPAQTPAMAPATPAPGSETTTIGERVSVGYTRQPPS